MPNCFFLLLMLLLANLLPAQPVITFFSPAKGAAGITVTITGNGFSTNLSDNIVRFGVAKAVVSAASPTTLTVAVPSGASYEPITVTTGGLSGSSLLPFNRTFGNGGITATSFEPYERISGGGTFALSDINDDGKTDISRATPDALTLFKNNSTVGLPLFQDFADLSKKVKYNSPLTRADFDGDGLTDLVVARKDSAAFTVFRNTSTTDRPRYDTGISFRSPPNAYSIAAADFDGDGRTDIAISSYDYSLADSLCIYRNTSSNGAISFTQAYKLFAEYTDLKTADFDGDGKVDLLATPYAGWQFTVLRNTCSPGNFSFTPTFINKNSNGDLHATVADFDGDGKPDIAVAKYSTSGVSVMRNITTGGVISFASSGIGYANVATPNRPHFIVADDMDGDGRADIITSNFTGNSVSVIRNTTTSTGTLSFVAAANFPVPSGSDPYDVGTADLDGDGKPEIVLFTTYTNNTLSIFRNRIGEPVSLTLCPASATTSITSNLTGNSYQWQTDSTGGGYVAISFPHPQLSAAGATLQLANLPSSWYGRKFRCLVDGVYGSETALKFKTTYSGPSNGAWETPANWSCGVLPDANTDVLIGYGNITVNSNVAVRSLRVNEGAKITVTAGKAIETK